MSFLAWLLAAILVCSLPGHVPSPLRDFSPQHQQAPGCPGRDADDYGDTQPRQHLQCLAGVAVKVSDTGMKVRPPHGSQRKFRFTDMTLFETDSGEGVLDGLMPGDYVCVGYTPHSSTLTALVVLFDPMSSPCSPRRQESSWAPSQVSPETFLPPGRVSPVASPAGH